MIGIDARCNYRLLTFSGVCVCYFTHGIIYGILPRNVWEHVYTIWRRNLHMQTAYWSSLSQIMIKHVNRIYAILPMHFFYWTPNLLIQNPNISDKRTLNLFPKHIHCSSVCTFLHLLLFICLLLYLNSNATISIYKLTVK